MSAKNRASICAPKSQQANAVQIKQLIKQRTQTANDTRKSDKKSRKVNLTAKVFFFSIRQNKFFACFRKNALRRIVISIDNCKSALNSNFDLQTFFQTNIKQFFRRRSVLRRSSLLRANCDSLFELCFGRLYYICEIEKFASFFLLSV